jgi:hypothetical protein
MMSTHRSDTPRGQDRSPARPDGPDSVPAARDRRLQIVNGGARSARPMGSVAAVNWWAAYRLAPSSSVGA